MSFNLGIDLGDDRVSAAIERAGTMRMVSFGDTRDAPLRVHVGRDGTITTGAAAVDAGGVDPTGLVTGLAARLGDPKSLVVNGYAVTGEGLLAHVLARVLELAEAQAGGEPLGQVVIAHAPTWSPATRAALLSAASQAGLVDAEVVPATRAREQTPERAQHLPEQALALGATVLAAARARGGSSAGAGAPRPPRPGRPAPPLATSSPTSVFDATDPAARVPAAGAGGAGGADGGTGSAVPPGSGDGGSNRVPFLIAAGVLVVLLGVLVVLLVTRDGGSDPVAVTGATGTSTSTPSASSTSSTASTTTSTASTTTSTSSTTTRPTSTTSTTTTIVAPPRIGPVALADNGLILQFGSATSFTLRFGDDADGTMTRLIALIGRPSSDTGWKQVELCTGDETRRAVFGDLEVVFTKNAAGAPNGSRTFQQWFVDQPGKRPDGLVTLDRVGIGTTIADLRKVYGDALKIVQPIPGDPAGLFTTSESGTFIDGITTGTADRSWVRQMWAGSACQRVAD